MNELTMQDIQEYIETGDKIPVSDLPSINIAHTSESEFNRNQTELIQNMTDNDYDTCNSEDLVQPEDKQISKYQQYCLEESRRIYKELGIKLTTNVDELPDI